MKYLLATVMVLLFKTNTYSQLNILKGNWEDSSAIYRLYITDTTGNNNTVRFSQIPCDQKFGLKIKNDTLLFTSRRSAKNRQEINFKVLLLSDSALKIEAIRNIEFYSSDSFSFPKKEIQGISLKRTERKFEQPIRFEKLRYRYGQTMIVGQENKLEIDSNGLVRYIGFKTKVRTDSNSQKHYDEIKVKLAGKLSQTDYAGFLHLIDSIQLPSLHFQDQCIMDGAWAEIIFNYNGKARIIFFALGDFDDAPDAQKLLTYLFKLPDADFMKPTMEKIDISFDERGKKK